MRDIDTSIRHYYQAQQLDRAKLDALIARAGNIPSANHYNRRAKSADRFPITLAALAASLLVAVTLFITLQPGTSPDINERVAHEIAMNHLKNLAVEYNGDDLKKISGEMTKLGFALRQPEQIDLGGLTLIGARYCSIQGQIAALLKYKDRDGEPVTLYQTQASPRLENLSFDDKVSDNIRITVWKEKDIVYGLAK